MRELGFWEEFEKGWEGIGGIGKGGEGSYHPSQCPPGTEDIS